MSRTAVVQNGGGAGWSSSLRLVILSEAKDLLFGGSTRAFGYLGIGEHCGKSAGRPAAPATIPKDRLKGTGRPGSGVWDMLARHYELLEQHLALNVEQQKEREAAEDFRKQLQEKSLGGHAQPSAAELLRWLDENPELLAQIARVSWGSARGSGLTPAQFKEELEAVPLPSPHDEPFTHSIVHMLSQQIEDACRELGIPLLSGVAYGSSSALDVSAAQYGVPLTDASVISLSTGFITFCSSISRMLSLSLPHEADGDRLKVTFNPGLVLAKIESNTDLRNYWEKVIGDYAFGSGPLSGGHHAVPFPASFTRMQLLFSMERFSLAHEYGHHVGQHGKRVAIGVGSDADAFGHEFEADLFALSLERYIGMRDARPNIFSASGAAAAVLLKCHDCIRRVRQILRTGEDAIQSDGTHPETPDRIAAFEQLDHQLPDSQREHLIEMRNSCVAIVDEMYRKLKPVYTAMHKRGARRPDPTSHYEFDPPRCLL